MCGFNLTQILLVSYFLVLCLASEGNAGNVADRGQDDSVDPVIIVPGTPELNVS